MRIIWSGLNNFIKSIKLLIKQKSYSVRPKTMFLHFLCKGSSPITNESMFQDKSKETEKRIFCSDYLEKVFFLADDLANELFYAIHDDFRNLTGMNAP